MIDVKNLVDIHLKEYKEICRACMIRVPISSGLLEKHHIIPEIYWYDERFKGEDNSITILFCPLCHAIAHTIIKKVIGFEFWNLELLIKGIRRYRRELIRKPVY